MEKFSQVLKQTFWIGIKTLIPVALTLTILIWIFYSIEKLFGHIIKYFLPENYYFFGLGALVGIVFVMLVGVFMRALLVQKLYHVGEKIINKIPLVKTIYSTLHDFIKYLDSSQKQEKGKVVVVSFSFGRFIGFLTREEFSELKGLNPDNEVAVYIPMSYQIGGFTAIVPKSSVKPLDITAEQGMSFVLMAGMAKRRY